MLFAAGHWADMNARMKYNLGMRKRNGYFRDEKSTFYDKRNYRKGMSGQKLSLEEISVIKDRVSKLRREDRKALSRQIIFTITILLAVIGVLYLILIYAFS